MAAEQIKRLTLLRRTTYPRYVKRAETLSTEIHAKHGLTREVLQAAMMKYQQEPSFLMAMTELQQQQAERFAAAASIFNGEVNMGLE